MAMERKVLVAEEKTVNVMQSSQKKCGNVRGGGCEGVRVQCVGCEGIV